MSERLTWHESLPAPFESGASIFQKIIELNHISKNYLASLISKKEYEKNSYLPNFQSSDWIDFDKFSHLLGVHQDRLEQGFLDQLGFRVPIKYGSTKIRWNKNCPECARYSYHCVFFDLAIVAECPWHHRRLVRQLDIGFCHCGLKSAETPSGTCSECGRGVLKKAMDLCFKRFSLEQTRTMSEHCFEFLLWHQSITQAANDYRPLIADIDIGVGEHAKEKSEFAKWQLGYAKQLSQDVSHWQFSYFALPARHIRLLDIAVAQDTGKFATIQQHHGVLYRSIKRQIYKRYVRPHSRCLKKLLSLNRDDSLCLDGSVCPLALAFLAWRMSIEGLGNIEGLRTVRKKNYQLRLMTPDDVCSLDLRIMWSYLGFFGLAAQLGQLCGIQKVLINYDPDTPCRGIFCSDVKNASQPGVRAYDVLCPSICDSYLSLNVCRLHRRNRDVVNFQASNNMSFWGWPREEDYRNNMFKVLGIYPEKLGNVYRYLTV
jgi:hypothetical protein